MEVQHRQCLTSVGHSGPALLQAQGIMPPPAPEAGPSLAKHEKVQAGNKVKTRSETRVQVKSEAADVIELSDDDYPMDVSLFPLTS